MWVPSEEKKLITNCRVSKERLEPIKVAMGWEAPNPQNEWPDNVISTMAIAYSCGMIARQGTTIKHEHAATELALCERLSSQAATIMKGILVGMGDENDHEFLAFYMCGTEGIKGPESITKEYIRAVFGDTI